MVFITFMGCSSCATGTALLGPGNLFRDKRRSFIKIDILKRIYLAKTSSISSNTLSEEYEIDLRSSASGFIVGHDREITLVATSAHVCSVLYGKQINYFVRDYSPRNPAWKMTEKALYLLNGYKGRTYSAFPIAFDFDADICILASAQISLPALKISQNKPTIGERYYNIAAPMGIWSSKMIPLFEGFYLGIKNVRSDKKASYVFSIPAMGGSSGSPILNSYGEVVGALHSAYRGFENICMATTNKEIYLIYRKSVKRLLKNYDQYKVLIDLINI